MKKQILAAAVLGALALPAAAQGFYLLGDVGQSRLTTEALEEYNTSFSVGAGYRINDYFAVETAYRDLGDTDADFDFTYNGDALHADRTFDYTALQLSVVGTIPFTDNFSAYARLGYAKLKYDFDYRITDQDESLVEAGSGSDSGYKAVYGLGARYALNDKIGLRLEFNDICELDGLSISAMTLGADYTF